MVQEENLYGIQRTCYSKSIKSGEQFIKEHGISYIVSGELEAYDGLTKQKYRAGDIILYRKNTLVRFVKYPLNDDNFEALSVIMEEELLQNFAAQHQLSADKNIKDSLFLMAPDELLRSYFQALMSFFGQDLNPALIELKKLELLHLVLRNNPTLNHVLFQFGMPGKINLEAFMNANFRFNVPITQLAFLTGRSLASFKRDFEKIFRTSPSRWLQQKRLEEAYFLLENKKMKTKDVYLEVGFETLSHFSYAFKNKFGVTPSSI